MYIFIQKKNLNSYNILSFYSGQSYIMNIVSNV
jgi:hypothetical protein